MSRALVALVLLLSGPARGATEGTRGLSPSQRASASPGAEIQVAVGETSVTLTCPRVDAVVTKDGRELSTGNSWTARGEALEQVERGAQYACTLKDTNTHLKIHMKVKVCEGCVDLGLGLVAGIILADTFFTLGVLLLVYFCSKRGPADTFRGGARREKPQGQKADSPPPVPNPDYEPIRKGQREVYAGLAPPRLF